MWPEDVSGWHTSFHLIPWQQYEYSKKDQICKTAPLLNTFLKPQKQIILKKAVYITEPHLCKQMKDIILHFSDLIPHASLG